MLSASFVQCRLLARRARRSQPWLGGFTDAFSGLPPHPSAREKDSPAAVSESLRGCPWCKEPKCWRAITRNASAQVKPVSEFLQTPHSVFHSTVADSCCSRCCEIDFCIQPGKALWAWEDLKMAQGVGFILACAFLYGLTAFLFRDQIKS